MFSKHMASLFGKLMFVVGRTDYLIAFVNRRPHIDSVYIEISIHVRFNDCFSCAHVVITMASKEKIVCFKAS